MKKKILSLALALVMCLGLAAPAFAAESDFVISNGVLTKYNGSGGNVVIPDGVTSIGDSAFRKCEGLTSVTIPNGVTSIGDSAFAGCSSLTDVTIPNSVTTIATNAFKSTPWVKSQGDFVVANGLLFQYQGMGGDVVVPSGVTTIGKGVFSYKTGLTSVTLPDGVTTIELQAFRNSYQLTTVIIPASVTTIGEQAFYSCSKLTNLTIPNGVTTIGSSAFTLCSSLTSLTLPDSVTSIANNPFCWCEKMTAIYVSPGNQNYTDRDGVLFSKDMTKLIAYPAGKKGAYVIPNGVTTICYRAFEFSTGPAELTIPNSVTTIENAAFCYCDGLGNLTIPSSVTQIGEEAFALCGGLTGVTVPGSFTTIETNVFRECRNLTDVTILDGVTTIGKSAFAYDENLTNVTIPASVTSILARAFYSCDSLTDVYYGGSAAQWNAVTFGEDNDPLKNATIHYNSAAPQTPAQPTVTTVGGFTDVKTSDWFADPVLWAVEKGITTGTSATAFSPNADCSTAQILTFLWRANGSPAPTTANPFSDVKSSDWYAGAAAWAYENGMISGGTFGGDAPCTRSAAVTYLWKAAGSPSAKAASFTDVSANADYAQAVAWAVEQGVTTGTSETTFSPDSVCTRGQIVTFLYRALN